MKYSSQEGLVIGVVTTGETSPGVAIARGQAGADLPHIQIRFRVLKQRTMFESLP
jgi:hypothetical protein